MTSSRFQSRRLADGSSTGVAASTRQDPQAKGLGEWLRARVVDIEVVPAAIVRGTVVDARTGREVVGALVWVDDGDAVKTGDGGVFELPGVLPGVHRLTAQWNVGRRSPPRLGRRDVELAPGGVYDDIEINID